MRMTKSNAAVRPATHCADVFQNWRTRSAGNAASRGHMGTLGPFERRGSTVAWSLVLLFSLVAAAHRLAAQPAIASISPPMAAPSTIVTITGTNLGATPGTLTFDSKPVTIPAKDWSPTSISATVPSTLGAGSVKVVASVGAVASNEWTLSVVRTIPITVTPQLIQPLNGKLPASMTVAIVAQHCDDTTGIDLSQGYSLTITGNGLSLPSQLNATKCRMTPTITIDPAASPGIYSVLLLNKDSKSVGSVDLTVMDSTAGPIPPGLSPQVDVMWEVMSESNCGDIFGKRISQREYCIQLKVGNNSGHPLQIAGVGFKRKIDILPDEPLVTIANASYASSRAVLIRENVTDGRNIAYNALQAAGVLMAGFTPFFRVPLHQSHYATAVSIVSGPLLAAFNIVAPNPVIGQLSNLDDESMRDNLVIPNNAQIQTTVFVEKQALTIQLADLEREFDKKNISDGAAKQLVDRRFKDTIKNSRVPAHLFPSRDSQAQSPLLVKLALGSLVIVGQQIDYLQRVQIQSNAVSSGTTVAPTIANVSPATAAPGAPVTISGTNFGATQGASTVKFGGTSATATAWSATSITATVPNMAAAPANIVVSVGGTDSNPWAFAVNCPASGPCINSASPSTGIPGTPIVITGANFGATQGTSTVRFGGTSATPTAWSATSITVAVPNMAAAPAIIVVSVGGTDSNPWAFAVNCPASGPCINSASPSTGPAATSVAIAGANFGATQGTSTVKFGGTSATPTAWSANSITVPVPKVAAGQVNVVVSVGGTDSNAAAFTAIAAPAITGVSPATGARGVSVTIAGANFGATQGTSTVKFGGTSATPTAWSATSITVPVPNMAAAPAIIVVSVGGTDSNPWAFAVNCPASGPCINAASPSTGPATTSVVVTGANFGATQGTSTVKFGSTPVTPTAWSASSITVTVPSLAAGQVNVVVSVGGTDSNAAAFTVQ